MAEAPFDVCTDKYCPIHGFFAPCPSECYDKMESMQLNLDQFIDAQMLAEQESGYRAGKGE